MPHLIDERCDGCASCAMECPVDAISGVRNERHEIDAQSCIDCGICAAVCPTGAAVAAGFRKYEPPTPKRLPRPVFDPHKCTGCGLCVSYCAFDCIELAGEGHRVAAYLAQPDACVACGECEVACMDRAVVLKDVDASDLDPERERRRAVDGAGR